MNKKLLGITAICLLGVGAAFASTTSTVYFTASGNLTKYIAPLDPSNEQDKKDGENEHSSEKPIGISQVYTTIGTARTNVKAISKGEELTSGSIEVKYSKNGKTANPSTTKKYVNKAPYIYHEIYISGMEFSQKGDLYLIPIVITNFDSVSHYISYYYEPGSGDHQFKYTDYVSLSISNASNSSLNSSLLRYRFLHHFNNVDRFNDNNDEGENITTASTKKYANGWISQNAFDFADYLYEYIYLWYLEISLSDDYTDSSSLTFNNAKISLEFM